jgi:hypothetical protein
MIAVISLLFRCLSLVGVLFAANVFVPSAAWGYDGHLRASIVYDGASPSVFGYDSASTLSANECAKRGGQTGGAFAKRCEFLAAKGTVVLDADPIISAIAQGRAAAVDAAIAGRTPVVPITAAKQVIPGHGADALREFLVARGGRIGLAGSEATAAQLRALGPTLNPARALGVADSRIAASALREGAPVLTNDRRFFRFLQAIGQAAEGY